MSRDRAVSSVLGVVMILGITAGTITAMMLVGAVVLQDTQTETRHSQMETAMAQMSSKASLTALGDADVQQFDLGLVQEGSISVQPDAGNVTLEYVDHDSSADNITFTRNLGALVYNDDDTQIAYQGGGVWKRSVNDGAGEMISPPEYHYHQSTLTFPIVRVDGEMASSSRGSGVISYEDTVFPSDEFSDWPSNPIANATIYIEIESDYHEGWHTFFDSRSDGLVEHDERNQTVRAELTAIYESEFTGSLAVQDNIEYSGQLDAAAHEGRNYPSATDEVDRLVDECDGTENFTASGTYGGTSLLCAESSSMPIASELVFQTEGDDIDVVVPAGIDLTDSDITIEGNGTVSFYTKGGIEFGNNEYNIDHDGDPENLFFYAHSEAVESIDFGASGSLHGVIYAPNSLVDFRGAGGMDFEGAVVADTFRSNGNIELTYAESLEGHEFGFDTHIDELHYLHVTENIISIELD